ncbi:MAG: peptide-methionine (S)-S-oxide reductase MsrA [Allorhizobium sp.]
MFLIDMFNKKTTMPTSQSALPGREQAIATAESHFVSGRPLKGPFAQAYKTVLFAMGHFWGPERLLWQVPGVFVTAAGYTGGITPNPTHQETVTGLTGHAEAVMVVFDPQQVSLEALLKVFFEVHDPTQGLRQGNDIGTAYRSAIYVCDDADLPVAHRMRETYQAALAAAARSGKITTEIALAKPFFYAEDYHQQYLAKNPGGTFNQRSTGVACPSG